jgi:multidrug resistance efflux pump
MRNSNVLADESAARSDAESLKVELERVEHLRAEKLIDATTVATVRREYQAAAARVKVFDARRAKMPEIYGAQDGRAQVAAQTEARVRPYREALKAKKAALAELDFRLAQHQLRAPVDGTVSLLTHQVGDVVPAGGEVLKLVRGRAGYVMATVPEERARSLRTGLTLTVRASRGLWSTSLRGTVVELGPSVEQLPERSWLAPQYPRWGRRATIQVEGGLKWKAGERLYVHF